MKNLRKYISLLCLFTLGCSAPKERRGDWMEHLNYRQFNFNAPTIHWDRHNYYSLEELKVMWDEIYQRTQQRGEEQGANE